MADPSRVTASQVNSISIAVHSTNTLEQTVAHLKGRDKTLHRLHLELKGINSTLESLSQVAENDMSIPVLLKGLIDRCSKVCLEFEQTMKSFHYKSKTGVVDWTKLEFLGGDINEFIDTISEYDSVITVELGIMNMFVSLTSSLDLTNGFASRTAKISQQALQDYNETIQNTEYNLTIHLQRIDERMLSYTSQKLSATTLSANLSDEKEATKLCLRICEDSRNYLESLMKRESNVLYETETKEEDAVFETQRLTRQILWENRRQFGKIFQVGDMTAEDNSDLVVANTSDGLFTVKGASSKNHSTQLVSSTTEFTLRHLTDKRYGSHFGSSTQTRDPIEVISTSPTLGTGITKDKNTSLDLADQTNQSPRAGISQKDPSSNEVRKRSIL